MSTIHWIDYVILAILALSTLTGLFRGFVKELIALCVWVIAIWLAFSYSPQWADWFQSYIHDKTARVVVSFIAILLLTLIVGGLFNALLSFILNRSGLNGTDRILGMAFGFIRGVFIVSLLMLAAKLTALPYQTYSKESYLYTKFDPMVNWLYGYTPEFIKKMKVIDHQQEKKETLLNDAAASQAAHQTLSLKSNLESIDLSFA